MACESVSLAAWLTLLTWRAHCSKTRLILDKKERIVAVLVGQPDDPRWRGVIDDATGVMREVERCGADMELFTQKTLHHRRGVFLAIPAGVSFGGGQKVRAQSSPSTPY